MPVMAPENNDCGERGKEIGDILRVTSPRVVPAGRLAYEWAMGKFILILPLQIVVLVASIIPGAQAYADCPDGNLLKLDQIAGAYGVIREQRLLDGRVPGEGVEINDYNATLFAGPDGRLVFDLGAVFRLSAVDLVTGDYDAAMLEASSDGISYRPVPLDNSRPLRRSLQQRWAAGLALEARYLRLQPKAERGFRAVAEFRVFCRTPRDFPDFPSLLPAGPYQTELERLQARNIRLNYLYFGLALAAIPALFLMRRLGSRRRNALALFLVIIGCAAWIRFGYFAGAGELLHPHDATHYYLGAKYFDELRYRELYRCIARAERENGRGFMVDRVQVRDLDNYVGHPGSWTRLPEGACRAPFADARWREFKDDVDMMRRLFERRHFHGIMKDHGYNATPVFTAWLAAQVNAMPATRTSLYLFAVLDIALIFMAVAVLWWGFGPVVAAVAALTLGLSELSSYDWIGGSLGRSAWLAALCAGLACLKRGYSGAGAVLATLAGLLRLIPFAFVGALGLYVLVRVPRHRKLERNDWRMIIGGVVMLGVGFLTPLIMFGPDVYEQFVTNTLLHSGNVSVNRIGLGPLIAAASGPHWVALTAKGVAVLLSVLFIVHLANLNQAAWSVLPLGGLLIYGALGLGYDYAWLVVLAPFARGSLMAGSILLGFVAVTNLTANLLPVREGYLLLSGLLIIVLPAILYHGQKAMGALRAEKL